MTTTIIQNVQGAAQVGYGVNIWETELPTGVQGIRQDVVGIVGAFPWGPPNVVTRVTSPQQFQSTFAPAGLPINTAVLALYGKVFPGGCRIVRVEASDAAAAGSGSITAGSGTITITAKYKGTAGNYLYYQLTAASGGDAAKRDLKIFGSGTVLLEHHKDIAHGSVTSVSSSYVTITASSPTAMPTAGSATALISGSDGTIAAADYVGVSGTNKGIRLFYANSAQADVLFVAEPATGLVADINTGLEAWAADTLKGIAVLCTPTAQSVSSAITYVASYRSDRLVYPWPRVTTTYIDGTSYTLMANSWVAAAILNVQPEQSPGGAEGAPYLTSITGVEDDTATRQDLDDMLAAGVACLIVDENNGPMIRGAVTTSVTAGYTKIFRRRMTDYILRSIARRAAAYSERPLDVYLTTRTLGPVTTGEIGDFTRFLGDLKGAGRIASYSVDPFSGNTQTDLDAGRFNVLIAVKLFGVQDEIVLKGQIGETVQISE